MVLGTSRFKRGRGLRRSRQWVWCGTLHEVLVSPGEHDYACVIGDFYCYLFLFCFGFENASLVQLGYQNLRKELLSTYEWYFKRENSIFLGVISKTGEAR